MDCQTEKEDFCAGLLGHPGRLVEEDESAARSRDVVAGTWNYL
jgi:hypothetical protein